MLVELTVRVDRLPAAVEASLFFVCAESLTNVGKHAAASRVLVDVREEDGTISIRISDDGRGFASAPDGRGRGLGNMRARARTDGGELLIDASPTGTTVSLLLPIG